jgi:hypothetical protein
MASLNNPNPLYRQAASSSSSTAPPASSFDDKENYRTKLFCEYTPDERVQILNELNYLIQDFDSNSLEDTGYQLHAYCKNHTDESMPVHCGPKLGCGCDAENFKIKILIFLERKFKDFETKGLLSQLPWQTNQTNYDKGILKRNTKEIKTLKEALVKLKRKFQKTIQRSVLKKTHSDSTSNSTGKRKRENSGSTSSYTDKRKKEHYQSNKNIHDEIDISLENIEEDLKIKITKIHGNFDSMNFILEFINEVNNKETDSEFDNKWNEFFQNFALKMCNGNEGNFTIEQLDMWFNLNVGDTLVDSELIDSDSEGDDFLTFKKLSGLLGEELFGINLESSRNSERDHLMDNENQKGKLRKHQQIDTHIQPRVPLNSTERIRLFLTTLRLPGHRNEVPHPYPHMGYRLILMEHPSRNFVLMPTDIEEIPELPGMQRRIPTINTMTEAINGNWEGVIWEDQTVVIRTSTSETAPDSYVWVDSREQGDQKMSHGGRKKKKKRTRKKKKKRKKKTIKKKKKTRKKKKKTRKKKKKTRKKKKKIKKKIKKKK